MEKRRAQRPVGARPRYRRITAAASSAIVTMVAVLGATGVIPTSHSPDEATAAVADASPKILSQGNLQVSRWVSAALPRYPIGPPPDQADDRLPARSGNGKRVVFDMSDQRVWLVDRGNQVRRTYPVSGSLTDNLDPGRYQVYSRSLNAIGIDDSGTMKYMVRFAHGDRAAIGFHDIPVHRGKPVQTVRELGTPQSHGCIRQRRVDAKALWRFAPIGSKVVVRP